MAQELTHIEQTTRIKQIAAMHLTGANTAALMKEFKLSGAALRRLQASEEYKSIIQVVGDEAVKNARNSLRARVDNLAPEVWGRIVDLIRSDRGKDATEGLKLYFRLIGLDKIDSEEQSGNVIINLPGQEERVIEVKQEPQDADTV